MEQRDKVRRLSRQEAINLSFNVMETRTDWLARVPVIM
jgi:hypothetical protein